DSAHGEVAKVFSHTRHTIIPDLMVISSAAWERLAPADQEVLAQAALQSSLDHRAAWAEAITAAEEEAEVMGVEFVEDVDLDAFRAATRPVLECFSAEYPEVETVLTLVDSLCDETQCASVPVPMPHPVRPPGQLPAPTSCSGCVDGWPPPCCGPPSSCSRASPPSCSSRSS